MTKRLSYANRAVVFIMRLLGILLALALAVVLVFFSAMQAMETNVLLREGLDARAQVIFHKKDSVDLAKYFSAVCIDADQELKEGRYDDFTISLYNHKIDAPLQWILPWQSEIELQVTETMVNLKGYVTDRSSQGAEDRELPGWINGRYRIVMQRTGSFWSIDSKWMITEMELLEEVEVAPLPIPSILPTNSPVLTAQPT
jgi:hypothetical protein